jgi:ribonuclease P protein component
VASPQTFGRIAILVPRYDHSAVARNKVKRRLRELVRRELLSRAAGHDVVIRATPAAYAAQFSELQLGMRRIAADIEAAS